MPAIKKISKEAIVKAAFSILRKEGYEAVNARSIAKKLGCSTQPIYRSFEGMEELKLELVKAAGERHSSEVLRYMNKSKYTKYKAYGLGFVRFAVEEKELFRYLYLTPRDDKLKPYLDVNLTDIHRTMCEEYGYDMETAEKFHFDMTIYSYGLAIGMNIGTMEMSDEEISERLQTEFIALTKIYGVPSKRPQLVPDCVFENKAGDIV